MRAARPRKFLYYRTRRSAGTAVTAAYVSLTWEPGWEVVEKANARALEAALSLLESKESQFTLRGEGVHLRE